MKINIDVNEQNIIIQWRDYPIDETKPILEIENPHSIHIGVDKFINGELVKDDESYNKKILIGSKYTQIQELKKKLNESDYKLFKYLEGVIPFDEYEVIKTQRQSWRNEINQLEAEIEELKQ